MTTPSEEEARVAAEEAYGNVSSQPLSAGAVRNARMQAFERGYLAALASRVSTPPSVEEWTERVHAERARHAGKGYGTAHDREHGVKHLVNWAIDYARRGEGEKASSMMLAVLELVDSESISAPAMTFLEAHPHLALIQGPLRALTEPVGSVPAVPVLPTEPAGIACAVHHGPAGCPGYPHPTEPEEKP